MTAPPLVPATLVVRRFPHEITKHDVREVPVILKSQRTNNQYCVTAP